MNNLGDIIILSATQELKIIESLRRCKGCYFNSKLYGCRKSKYLPPEYVCGKDNRLDNKNIIYKRIK